VGQLLAEPGEYLGHAAGWPAVASVRSDPQALEAARWVVDGQWKARHVAAWVGQRPFVWFEDDADAVASLARQPGLGRHLMVKVEPVIGLTTSHVEQARAWLDDLHR
jgi:hypothetical protein